MTSLNPVMTVGRQISEALKLHMGMDHEAARRETVRLFDKVRIPAARSRFDEFPHQFSGGMRQRVMIAMALACKPRVLIADEPTTALDVTIQAQIIELIKELQASEGMGVLFITHDMSVVAEIADRMLVMYRGETIEAGATDEVFRAPRRPYTRALLAAVPTLGSMAGSDRPSRFPQIDIRTGDTLRPGDPAAHEVGGRKVLEVRNLVTRFDIRKGLFGRLAGRVHAVEDVTFSISRGETLSLVGESGCGKSTTGRAILKLISSISGSVKVEGMEMLSASASELQAARRRVQMIFQDPFASLNPRIRIGSAIAEPYLLNRLGTRRDAETKVTALLEQVGLSPDMARRFPHELSGGQRQRVCIARALSLDPALLVADESVSALDVSVKAQIVNLLIDLQEQRGLSYLFISHDMAVVERISHRVAVMYLGEIVEIGPRAAVFGNPQHPYTRHLLASVPLPDPARRRLRREISNKEIRSAIRPADFTLPPREYRSAGADHFVQSSESEWP